MHGLFDFAHLSPARRASLTARLYAGALALGVTAVGCSSSAPGPGGPAGGGAFPAMAVEIVTLSPKPIDRVSEFVGTIKSRRSTTIQPSAEGYITSIAVTSGARVKPGDLLVEVDAKPQEAVVANLESTKAAREADLAYAQVQEQREKKLLDVGAASQQEYDQAANALKNAQAQAQAINDQIRQQRSELGYYRVTAPTAGKVGDIPVRVGDRVTKTTVLTTVDDNSGLEIYLNVPVQQAPGLKLGLPVRLIGDTGEVIADERITFISSSVDDGMQTVLVKAALPSAGGFRTDQFVRARVVWSTEPGLTVPVTSVVRVNGQYFAFVAQAGQRGGLAAHQQAVTLGPVLGNDYVLLGGLKAGDQLIVSGIQKIGEGAPVRPSPPAAPGGPGATGKTEGR
jgi:RND family efflux transporter MFP subunit